MSVEYLFRIDQAKDNDAYFETTKNQGVSTAYAGVEIKIGQGWVPDLVRVSRQDFPEPCILTLIELETSKPEALKSSRNAYPVDSGASIGGSLPLWGGRLIQRPCERFALNCPHERLVWTTWYGLAGLTGSLARTVAAKTPT